jgi:hypothetical protein
MQQHDAFQYWQRERDAVETEMNELLTAGLPASSEDRQIRHIQFQALVERREAAAGSLLAFDRSLRHHKSPATQVETAAHQSRGDSSESVPGQQPVEPMPPLEPAEDGRRSDSTHLNHPQS